MNRPVLTLLDCTLYYNNWDFDAELVRDYLLAMQALDVDYVELGFRSLDRRGFRGAYAYTSDSFLRTLDIPEGLRVAVMVNASELLRHAEGWQAAAALLFVPVEQSPVALLRLACHVHEFAEALPICDWLKGLGYNVGINLMQVADRQPQEIEVLARQASGYGLDVLYFADSMGSLSPAQTSEVIAALRRGWQGEMGIHTHDNCSMALANTQQAIADGVLWLDSTVTGMGRGPGNVRTEYLFIVLMARYGRNGNIAPPDEPDCPTFPAHAAASWLGDQPLLLSCRHLRHSSHLHSGDAFRLALCRGGSVGRHRVSASAGRQEI